MIPIFWHLEASILSHMNLLMKKKSQNENKKFIFHIFFTGMKLFSANSKYLTSCAGSTNYKLVAYMKDTRSFSYMESECRKTICTFTPFLLIVFKLYLLLKRFDQHRLNYVLE